MIARVHEEVRDMKQFEFTRPLGGTALEIDEVVPGVPMIDAATGASVSLWDLRQRFAAAVCFLHGSCRTCAAFVRALRSRDRELRDADAVALVIAPAPAYLEPPVWLDQDGRAREHVLGPGVELPVILIVDRYGAAAESFPSPGHAFPSPEEVVATLRHLAMQCPECGVSEW
jgi:hypothetical protein